MTGTLMTRRHQANRVILLNPKRYVYILPFAELIVTFMVVEMSAMYSGAILGLIWALQGWYRKKIDEPTPISIPRLLSTVIIGALVGILATIMNLPLEGSYEMLGILGLIVPIEYAVKKMYDKYVEPIISGILG